MLFTAVFRDLQCSLLHNRVHYARAVQAGIQDTQIFGALHWARVFGMAWIRVGFMPGCLGQLCAGIHLLLVVLPVG